MRERWDLIKTTPAPPATALCSQGAGAAPTDQPGLRREARGGRRAAAHLLPAWAPSRCGPWSLPWARRSPARSSRSRKTSLRWRCRCRGRRSGPRRFRVLPRQNASPTPPPGALPHVPANLRCFSRHGPAPPGRPDNPRMTLACGIAPHRRHRGEAAATGHSRPAAPHAPPRNLQAVGTRLRRYRRAAVSGGARIARGPRAGGGSAGAAAAPLLPFPPLPTPFPPPSLPSSSRSLPFSLPALALGSRREPCTAAAGRRRSGGGSGDGGAGRAAAGAAPVPLGPGGGAGRGGRVLRHRHGRRRALVLAPGHGRGKRQLRDAAQLDRHDSLQLLQRHVRGPRVRPAGVDAGKRCLATASSRGLGGTGGSPGAGPAAPRSPQQKLRVVRCHRFSSIPQNRCTLSGHYFLLILFRNLSFASPHFALAASRVSSTTQLAPDTEMERIETSKQFWY